MIDAILKNVMYDSLSIIKMQSKLKIISDNLMNLSIHSPIGFFS